MRSETFWERVGRLIRWRYYDAIRVVCPLLGHRWKRIGQDGPGDYQVSSWRCERCLEHVE